MKWKKENNKDKFPSSKAEQEEIERQRRESALQEAEKKASSGDEDFKKL